MELWAQIQDDPRYSVSTFGRVKNNKTSRILKPYPDTKGYLQFHLGPKNRWVHREVAKCFLENPQGLPVIDHINRNKQDNRVENLRWATYSDNQVNREYKNTCTGERCIYTCKEQFVVLIRRKGHPRIQQYFYSLDEAKIFRDLMVEDG